MDIFGMQLDPLLLVSIVIPLGVAIVVTVLFYVVYFKPKIEKPLPNERDRGRLTISLPKGLGVRVGNATTARSTVEGWVSEVVQNETDDKMRKELLTVQKLFDGFHFLAQKTGPRQVTIYLFDQNPEDEKFMDVDPTENDSFIIARGIQDALSVGEWNGCEFVAVKLNPQTKMFSTEERGWMEASAEITKYLRDAAKNTEKIHLLKEELGDTRLTCAKALEEVATMRSELDRCKSALAQKELRSPAAVKVPGAWREKVKEWISWKQLITAFVGFVSAPFLASGIQSHFGIILEPPVLTYFVGFITFLGFFSVPIFKKLFGRWL